MTTSLAITGLGLVSSLGSTSDAAAAFRAGISRARAQECFPVEGPDEDGPSFVVGHAARPAAEGFDQMAAWLRLARHAMADLRMALGLAVWQQLWRETALIVALPIISVDRYGWDSGDPAPTMDQFFTQKLLTLLGHQLPDDRRMAINDGHTAVAIALHAARERLTDGRWRRVVLLAVDTSLDRSSVTWLQESDRLKLPGNPHGVMPGEAAVAMLLELPGDQIGQSLGVTVEDVALDLTANGHVRDENRRETPDSTARRLAENYYHIHPVTGDAQALDQYADINGETWRADVWGNLQSLVSQRIHPGRTWYPAEGFGETGAASCALACVLASRSWARGYAGSDGALIWSLAENGHVGVIALRRAQ